MGWRPSEADYDKRSSVHCLSSQFNASGAAPYIVKSRVILGGCLLFALFQAESAEFTVGGRTVLIEGEITVGDFEKLRKITDYCPLSLVGTVELASPGGNITEAIKMGRLVRSLRLSTSAPITSVGETETAKSLARQTGVKDIERNNTCTSACFFIYVAGVDRMGDTIGIHRPYFDLEVLRKSEGSDVIETSRSVKSIVESYLSEMGVPSKYAELMFDTRKDEIRWLTKDEISQDFFGLIPELQDWVESRCGKHPQSKYQSTGGRVNDTTKTEALAFFKESQRYFDCHRNSLQEMRYDVSLQNCRKRQRDPLQ